VRPVREQLEHDRVIRLLQAKYKRNFEVAINPGPTQASPVVIGASPWYPDLVFQSTDRGHRLLGTVEVETAESVNNLEAMSQWATFARLRAPFYLYVPVSSVDTAKRLCASHKVSPAEIWAFSWLGEQVRFTLVQRSAVSQARAARASRAAATRATRPAASSRPKSSRKAAAAKKRPVPAKGTKAAKAAKVGKSKKAAKVTKARKSAKAGRSTKTVRVAKKASKSSRPKTRK
jgi:hypothetical protein